MNTKKSNNLQTHQLFIYVVLLTIWCTLGAYLLLVYSPVIGFLGIALNFLILAVTLTDLFPSAPWVSLVVSIALYLGAGYSLLTFNEDFLNASGVGTGVFIVTALFSAAYSRQVHKVDEKYNRLQQVTDSLVIYDRYTSLMRWKFAQQSLTTEVLRGRRYQSDVSVVLFDYRQKDQLTPDEIRRINKVVAEIVQDGIRTNLDIAFIDDRIGLILPETPLAGAMILTKRLVQKFNRQVDARVVAGIANFPDDAITDEDLYESAQTALMFALNSDQTVVDYGSLQNETPSNRSTRTEQAQPVVVEGNHVHTKEDYIAILEDISLDDNEWIVWVEGLNQMDDLITVEQSLGRSALVQSLEFLFLQANHLVVKVCTYSTDLLDEEEPFPGWEIKKANENTHYLLIAQTPVMEPAQKLSSEG